MSTLTSLVKSGKRKIFKKKTVEPAEGEQKGIKVQQKPLESSGASASNRGFLGRPDPEVARSFLGRPDPGVSQGYLSQPDPGVSRSFLGQPDPGVSQDATKPQHDSET